MSSDLTNGVPEMNLTYNGKSYEVSATEVMEMQVTERPTSRGIAYQSRQVTVAPGQPLPRRIYRGEVY